MTEFAAQLEKAKELAASGSLVVPPAQSESLWLPPVKEPGPEPDEWTQFFKLPPLSPYGYADK
jgi:hypothetical protein